MTDEAGNAAAALLRKVAGHDPPTALHMKRVSRYASLIAAGLGLDDAGVAAAAAACSMHDIGKLALPRALLSKRAALSAEELRSVRAHVAHGHELILASGLPGAEAAAAVAFHHHEKFDGSGYPGGLRGGEIPLHARIAAVADVFDALTSRRPHRCAMDLDFALEYVRRQGNSHFDPDCVAAFCAEETRIMEVRRRFPESRERSTRSEELEQG